MKIRLSFLALGLVLSSLVVSCKKDPPPEKTDKEINKEILMSTVWVPGTGSNQVTVGTPPTDVTADWAAFELTFGSTGYTTTGADNYPEIWPASGTWDFGDNATTIIRDGALQINIASISDTALKLEFTYTAGRINGIEGDWVFNLEPK